jgi:hypothetical protein
MIFAGYGDSRSVRLFSAVFLLSSRGEGQFQWSYAGNGSGGSPNEINSVIPNSPGFTSD